MNSQSWKKVLLLALLGAQARIGSLLSRAADPVANYGRALRIRAERRMKELER
ncbi:hypothetical protein [Caulobacter sp. SSI4214]|uniref:hypothetical protein n=1 Tax=Caulobacter sp. SSI4214 TaxID=2575739 RepID=UPI001438F16A|nr:hypothetical protein [Caulobacter sp. SSI4214]